MAIYAISDLHLALSVDKPMDVFGSRWADYMSRLKQSWENTVKDGDTVIIPGDISWATYIEQAVADFEFIEKLPGKKIISKGNHDYWWTTMGKLDKFLDSNGFSTIKFMHNNSYIMENSILCGTRGWKCPGEDDFSSEDEKIYKRELIRLELSLKTVPENLRENVIVALHYPPFNSDGKPSGFVDMIRNYGVKICIYGHLHGAKTSRAVEGLIENTQYILVSADHLGFVPLQLNL